MTKHLVENIKKILDNFVEFSQLLLISLNESFESKLCLLSKTTVVSND